MVSIKAILIFTLLTGILYPLAVTVAGKALFSKKANGSLILNNGRTVGSELIGQEFSQPKYFWSRPSAVKYDSGSSGASNLGVTSSDLLKVVHERESKGAVAEMKYSSASGLDPHISPESAHSQVSRVAEARGIKIEDVIQLVNSQTEERQLGFLGQKRVNVLLLNLALDGQLVR